MKAIRVNGRFRRIGAELVRAGGAGGGGGGSGTMTSLQMPASEFDVADPTGDAVVTWDDQTTNKVLASPNGSTGQPSFRALVAADIPAHGASQHTGSIFPSTPADQSLGDAFFDLGDIAAPATPSSGTIRLFFSLATGKLSVKKSDGSTVSLEEQGGAGTVTSVNVALAGTTSSGAVTSSGTITLSWDSQTQNKVFASPNGSSGTPTFRALVANDIPDLSSVYQPLDADLTAIAALTSAANKAPYATGSGTWALYDLSAFARTILDDADAGAVRTTISAAATGAVTSSGITMSTARLLGRTTASTGAIEELTVGTGLTLSGGSLVASTASRTRQFMVSILDPTSGDSFMMGRIPWNATVTRVGSVTDTGTLTFNVEERSTIGSAGTDVLTSDQVADATGEEATSSFANASLAAGNWLFLSISGASGTPGWVNVWVEVTVD